LAALFSIDVIKTPEFFADREVEALDCNGHRKKIFHIVRTHGRASGGFVKTHFRGVRNFSWNGHAIEISVPYRDHFDMAEFDLGALDEDEAKRTGVYDTDMIGMIDCRPELRVIQAGASARAGRVQWRRRRSDRWSNAFLLAGRTIRAWASPAKLGTGHTARRDRRPSILRAKRRRRDARKRAWWTCDDDALLWTWEPGDAAHDASSAPRAGWANPNGWRRWPAR
jgi:hypothetical protein